MSEEKIPADKEESRERKEQFSNVDRDGYLGNIFGYARNAPTNIAGVLVCTLLTAGITSLFVETKIPSEEFWKMISPVLTLVLGYLFGQGGQQNQNNSSKRS